MKNIESKEAMQSYGPESRNSRLKSRQTNLREYRHPHPPHQPRLLRPGQKLHPPLLPAARCRAEHESSTGRRGCRGREIKSHTTKNASSGTLLRGSIFLCQQQLLQNFHFLTAILCRTGPRTISARKIHAHQPLALALRITLFHASSIKRYKMPESLGRNVLT